MRALKCLWILYVGMLYVLLSLLHLLAELAEPFLLHSLEQQSCRVRIALAHSKRLRGHLCKTKLP